MSNGITGNGYVTVNPLAGGAARTFDASTTRNEAGGFTVQLDLGTSLMGEGSMWVTPKTAEAIAGMVGGNLRAAINEGTISASAGTDSSGLLEWLVKPAGRQGNQEQL